MQIAAPGVVIGFPNLHGLTMDTYVERCDSNLFLLWFHSYSRERRMITRLRVFLTEASLEYVNLTMCPFFPEMRSYSIEPNATHGGKNRLRVIFETGELAILFDGAWHLRSCSWLPLPGEGAQ